GGVAHDHGGPRARLGILPERLAFVSTLDHPGEPVVAREAEVPSEAVARVHLPAVAAHRPVEDEGLGRLRIARGEGDGDRAAHAPAEHESSLDAEVLEEVHALLGAESPGESLYAATGRTRLTAVVGNHLEGAGERVEGLHLLPHARRSPLLPRFLQAPRG